jgi:hypothetical protein
MTDIKELHDKIDQHRLDTQNLESKFAKAIKDKSVSLDARWSLFCCAPNELKNYHCYVVDCKFKGKEIEWYNLGYNKYETIDMKDVVDRLYEDQDKSDYKYIEELMEYILSKNLGSFYYAW